MILQMINKTQADKVWVSIYNSTAVALSAGYNVCFHTRTVASANGIDVEQPVTSALANYAGVVASTEDTDTSYSIAVGDHGTAQCYGYNDVVFLRHESTGGVIPAGDVWGPVNAQWYAHSAGTAYEFGPLTIMSQLAANTFEARARVFIRAL